MGLLIDGEWSDERPRAGGSGEFVRPSSTFRHRISAAERAEFPALPGRYHLYVARACPWCHRTLIARVFKRLESSVSVSFVEPAMLENGWTFAQPDLLTGARFVYELYSQADPLFTGRATLPVLWDKEAHTIVNNESADIVRMFNREFDEITNELTDYYPEALAAEIDEVNARIYETVNNGVYRAGFATTQPAYASAVRRLFDSLDWLEDRLQRERYLLGDLLTEADWRLFPTLVRFDAVYYGHFKCNLRHVYEYPALWGYTREIHQMPGIAATVAIDEYKAHYYGSHRNLNPTGIIPLGPMLDLNSPHGR
ncbi:MAG: glutathione S-transferase family protein [Steroidobacteraceae bacterium]